MILIFHIVLFGLLAFYISKSLMHYRLDFHREDSAHNKVMLIGRGSAVDFSFPESDLRPGQDTVSCFHLTKVLI